MVLEFILTTLSVIVSFLLQTSIFPAILPIHVLPNLLIIITASNGFMKDENVGMIGECQKERFA